MKDENSTPRLIGSSKWLGVTLRWLTAPVWVPLQLLHFSLWYFLNSMVNETFNWRNWRKDNIWPLP